MTENASDPAQVLAELMMDATKIHDELHNALGAHVDEVADTVLNAIRAKSEKGAKLRAALGVEVTQATRMGKNVRAAMDAYTSAKDPEGQAS